MEARVFVDVNDAKSYVGFTRFERAIGVFTILSGREVSVTFAAAGIDDPVPAIVYDRPAKVTGIDLNLDDIVAAGTDDAWRLLTWASSFGIEHQRELIMQLWRAHFLEGADIADHFVLASRAALAGLDLGLAEIVLDSDDYADEVELQRSTARAIGLTTTPFIVIDGHGTITGLRSQDAYIEALAHFHSAK